MTTSRRHPHEGRLAEVYRRALRATIRLKIHGALLPCRVFTQPRPPADAPGLHLETCHTGCYVPLTPEQANRLPAIFRMSRKQDRSYCRRRRRDINVLCAPVDAARDVTFSSRRRESFQHQSSQHDEQKDSQHLSSKRVFTQLRPLRGIGPIEIPVVVPDGGRRCLRISNATHLRAAYSHVD